jgi:hypothetical protein
MLEARTLTFTMIDEDDKEHVLGEMNLVDPAEVMDDDDKVDEGAK